MEDIAIQYFKFWNSQDLGGLRSLFKEDVSLKDWEIEVAGIDKVIRANANIFSDLPEVRAEILQLGTGEGVVFVQLNIWLTENENISVVDVLFIEDDKIKRIHAYKC